MPQRQPGSCIPYRGGFSRFIYPLTIGQISSLSERRRTTARQIMCWADIKLPSAQSRVRRLFLTSMQGKPGPTQYYVGWWRIIPYQPRCLVIIMGFWYTLDKVYLWGDVYKPQLCRLRRGQCCPWTTGKRFFVRTAFASCHWPFRPLRLSGQGSFLRAILWACSERQGLLSNHYQLLITQRWQNMWKTAKRRGYSSNRL